MRPSTLLLVSLALVVGPGCGSSRAPAKAPPPASYAEAEARRPDIAGIDNRSREAMAQVLGEGGPDGGVSQVISTDKAAYLPDDPVYLSVVWANNTGAQVRICRRLMLEANFRPLIFLNDEVRVLPSTVPEPPKAPLREADFVTLKPYGEHTETFDLKNLPRFGLAAGVNEVWGYNLSRPGRYKIRIGVRSIPEQLVPESLVGDPSTRLWIGSTLSNVVEFTVRRR